MLDRTPKFLWPHWSGPLAFVCALSLGLPTMVGAAPNANSAPESVRVMTYNIRCGSCEKPDDVNHWSKRKFLVAQLIEKSGADLIGLQEAELFQVRDLATLLPGFEWVGKGRDDGQDRGEMNAVLVRRAAFAIESQNTLWLSPTPQQVSRGWDAMLNRTLTVLKLKRASTGQSLYFLNTHFDHQGPNARNESAKLLVKLLPEWQAQAPVVLTGDFNDRPGFSGYRILAAQLLDAALASHSVNRGGNFTFNGFGTELEPGNKIDYVFVSPGVDVLSHSILTDVVGGLYPSDHFPIAVELRLP